MRTCYKEDGIFHYKVKNGQIYTKCAVEEKNVLELKRDNRWNKAFIQLKRTIYRTVYVSKSEYEPHICVVYSTNSDSYSKNVDGCEVREHGSSKQKTLYHRMDPTTLKCQNTLLSFNKPFKEVYDLLLYESGGPMQLNSMFQIEFKLADLLPKIRQKSLT